MISPTYTYRARAKRVLDADTFVVEVDLGFEVHVAIRIRVKDISAPELATAAGNVAREWAVLRLLPASVATDLMIRSYGRSFERWVCDVWFAMGTSYADEIVQAGHAVRING